MLKRSASEESEGRANGGATEEAETWLGSEGFDTDRTANAATKRREVAKTNRVGRERNLGIRNVFRLCGLRFVFRCLCCPAASAGMIVRGVFGVVKCFDASFEFGGQSARPAALKRTMSCTICSELWMMERV